MIPRYGLPGGESKRTFNSNIRSLRYATWELEDGYIIPFGNTPTNEVTDVVYSAYKNYVKPKLPKHYKIIPVISCSNRSGKTTFIPVGIQTTIYGDIIYGDVII